MTIGRMAVVQDPTGGTFAFWKANSPSPWPSDEKNAFGWAQLNCGDPPKAASFYSRLFGWTTRRDPMPQGGEYTTCQLGEVPVAGIMPKPPGSEGSPSQWLVYFCVDDVEAAFTKATSLGAQTYVPPTLIPQMVRFAVLADPQGAAFGLMSKV
jgi:hypothetical protein